MPISGATSQFYYFGTWRQIKRYDYSQQMNNKSGISTKTASRYITLELKTAAEWTVKVVVGTFLRLQCTTVISPSPTWWSSAEQWNKDDVLTSCNNCWGCDAKQQFKPAIRPSNLSSPSGDQAGRQDIMQRTRRFSKVQQRKAVVQN